MISGSFAACLLPVTVASFFVDKFTDPVRYFRAVSFTALFCVLNTVIDPTITIEVKVLFVAKNVRKTIQELRMLRVFVANFSY